MTLKISERFKWFMEEHSAGKFKSPIEIPLDIWGEHGWELIKKKKVEEILLPFFRYNITRAKNFMPIYKKPFDKINPKKIETMEDFWGVPALVKDSSVHGIGFREKINKKPHLMLPTDVKGPTLIYKSGGTIGVAAPTFITPLDREIETYAFKRGFEYEGMKSGDVALTTYNPTHKGGEHIKESFLKLGITTILRRTTDGPQEVIDNIRDYNVNILLTVQGPIGPQDEEGKGVGVSLLNLIEAGSDVIEDQIDIVFLGGYRLIDEAIAWAQAHKKPLVTLLGSTEAIPQATNTGFGPDDRECVFNNLHVLNGPHYIEVVKNEDGVLVPVKKGETGILAYTTVARQGTLYIRYFPGDQAKIQTGWGGCSCKIKSEIITDVMRNDIPTDVIEAGCCIG